MSNTMSICKKCETLNNINTEKALNGEAKCGNCSTVIELHGLVSEVNGGQLERIIKNSKKPVIVDFWASWCGPCQIYGPEFIEASKMNTDAVFLKVNTEEDPNISNQLAIKGIPTTIVFKNGKEYKRQSGALPKEMIGQLVK